MEWSRRIKDMGDQIQHQEEQQLVKQRQDLEKDSGEKMSQAIENDAA